MLSINWGELSPEQFLKEYWQKKPVLLKQALPGFTDSLDANELAGLAMEAEIESRIVAHDSNNNWQVEHGPFDDFARFGENNWTVLVQAANNWSRPTNDLLSLVDFIPNWRLDDVMVSFSTPQGSVGPHLDQYDVFIIQGEGKRRWQVGENIANLPVVLPHQDLKQVPPFTAIIDEITEPGDILYIPPGYPHNGVSIDNSMSFSIGFQAPSNQDLWSSFADRLIDDELGEQRFSDVNRPLPSSIESLSKNDISALKAFMLTQLNDETLFTEFLGKHLTQNHHTLELLIPAEAFTDEQVKAFTTDNEIQFVPVAGIKALVCMEGGANLFINGEKFQLTEKTLELGNILAGRAPLTMLNANSFISCLKNNQLLTSVLNKGYWYIE